MPPWVGSGSGIEDADQLDFQAMTPWNASTLSRGDNEEEHTIYQGHEYDVDADQARRLIEDRAAQVIDVREQYEHDAGHIPGDTYIHMGQVALETEALDPDRPVLFYCRVGVRAGMVTDAFRAAGWEAYNLDGGILAWVADGNPLEPIDGAVAEH